MKNGAIQWRIQMQEFKLRTEKAIQENSLFQEKI